MDWSEKPRRLANDLFQSYLALDDELRIKLEQDLHEIHAVASSFGVGRDIHTILTQDGLKLPEVMTGKTVQDQTMWVYLNANDAWCSIARFAHADKISESLWFSQKLIPLHDGDNLNSDDPDTDTLAGSISRYIVQKEGRGHHSYAEFFLRGGKDEYYFVYLNDYATVKMQCRQGQFAKGIDYASLEMVFIYHRDTQMLEVKVVGDAAKKLEICRRFASAVKKCDIESANEDKPQYQIEHIQRRDFEFTVDHDEKMVRATLYALCLSIRDCPGSKRLYEEKTGDIYERMEQEINKKVLPEDMRMVEYVKIRITLADEFGTSKRQTLKITRDSCNLSDKNIKVQSVLREAMARWQFVAA